VVSMNTTPSRWQASAPRPATVPVCSRMQPDAECPTTGKRRKSPGCRKLGMDDRTSTVDAALREGIFP
jgi:hypothetical protein